MNKPPLSLTLLALIIASIFTLSSQAAVANTPHYLAFQMFTDGADMGLDAKKCGLNAVPTRADIEAFADRLINKVGIRSGAGRHLALMIGPLSWDHSDATLKQVIRDGFAIAKSRQIAIGFHIDESKFWKCRTTLLSDPDNIEQIDWDSAKSSGLYINWGEPVKLAPPMAFTSKALRAEARRLAHDVIGKTIYEELTDIQPHLFAGVIAGWETAIGTDFDSRQHTGYTALKDLGYSKANPPEDKDRVLQQVLKDWIGLWTNGLQSAGLPKSKLYSHIAFHPQQQHPKSSMTSYAESVGYATPEAALGDHHLPGYSTYPNQARFEAIYQALATHGNPGWASAEGTNVMIDAGDRVIPSDGMESYLARMFNHGATLVTLFGWGLGERGDVFTISVENDEAIRAYRLFLEGKPLKETPLNTAYQVQHALPGKIQRMHEAIAGYVKGPADMARIKPLVERIDRHIKNGEPKQAETLVDKVLEITDTK